MPTDKTLYERMHALASNTTRARASAVVELLEDVKSDLEELGEIITEFIDATEMWEDEGADRESRAEAKETVDTLVNQLMGELACVVDKTYGEGSTVALTEN